MRDWKDRRIRELRVSAATFDVRDPRGFNGGDKPISYPLRRILVLVDGWIGERGIPVNVGDKIRLPQPEADMMVRLGRAEFV